MANALGALGVGAGTRVALMFSNDYRFLESLFGPMRLGAVPVPLNTRMGDDALQYVVEDAEATVLIANATAKTVHVGRTVSIADVEIRDASGTLVAVGRGCYASPRP